MGNRVTLKQVAALAGVSYQTISKVINNQVRVTPETETRIWKAVAELDYRPNSIARSLRVQRSHKIGYSWEPTPPGAGNPILDQFMQGMVSRTESSGYYLLAFPYRPGLAWTENYRELISTRQVDGFILSSVEYNDPRIQYLLEQDFPFVAFGRSNPDLQFPYVDIDGAAGMRLIIQHLVETGHRRIAVLSWPETSRVGQNRMGGVQEALASAGLRLPAELVARGEGSYATGYQSALKWLALPPECRPTAIAALSDTMAIGAMCAAADLGLRVGADLAVTGFDDTPIVQYLTPPLTTIRQPEWEAGRQAVSMLMEILDGYRLEESNHLLLPELVVRASSAKRPGITP